MSIAIHGIGLGSGVAIGNAFILDKNLDDATQYTLESKDITAEISRFKDAIKQTRRELENLRGSIPEDAPAELGAFLSLSIMMLNDSQISQAPINIIREEECNAEWAIKLQAGKLSLQFEEMEDEYLKERKYDVIQVLERIYKNLEGNQFDWDSEGKFEKGILVASDLSPADLVHFKDSNFAGFITEIGSLTSHTAIVGRNLDVPAVVSADYARQLIRDNELIIVDGINGVIIVNPDDIVLNEYVNYQKQLKQDKDKLRSIRKQQAVTLDNIKIELLANIESTNDIDDVLQNNANGIGLFRSEFLFLGKDNDLASEEEQFEAYSYVAKSMRKYPITIRTADLGADKNPAWHAVHGESMNPALGLTGIRLSLAEPAFFRTQLRAILRASFYGNIQVMFPMVSSAWELKQALNHLENAKAELNELSIPFNENIKVGAMIEVPSAALSIKSILNLCDFISIGTNDLIQYLLAIDRNDEAVNYLYSPHHPAVLKLIAHIIKNADKMDVEVSLCGEMAGDVKLTRLLLGLGLRKFSMYSSNILNIKNVILKTNLEHISNTVQKIMKTENLEKIEELIEELNMNLD